MSNTHSGASSPLLVVPAFLTLLLSLFSLAGCSPALDWREVRGTEAPYLVLMPAKPAVHTRKIRLDTVETEMTMRGAEVNKVTYAVGSATLASEAQAGKALADMQDAMLKNIGATVQQQKNIDQGGQALVQLVAVGKTARGETVTLHARFAQRGSRVYQAIVLGPAASVKQDAAETFLESFRPG